MEDTLREGSELGTYKTIAVLILVLMEDTLRAAFVREEKKKATSLNPCFNGRYSQRYG